MGYRFQISFLLLIAIASIVSAQTAPSKQFQIRVESKKDDQEVSPATLQQIRARQIASQQQQQQPSSEYYSDEDEEEDNVPVQTFHHRPTTVPQRQYQPQPQQHHHQQQQQQKKQLTKKQREQFEQELEEEEEPDHLALLLQKSSFSCNERTTGYYADDTVDCQVFHYCQDSTKHSWICPEGATFHQVHLICMPPSDENICQQSSKYHFVNDYLYKPINMEEFQSKPNVSLRYHERYYPENIYNDDRQEYEEEHERAPVRHQPKPVVRTHHQQQQQQQQNAYRQQQQQNAYRSPDEINISLQQRRPYFAQTTPRDEDEYNYEK